MAGELWQAFFQIGKESTPGTGVAATRRMYFNIDDSRLSRERTARPHRFATGSRDNVRAFTLGSTQVGGTVSLAMSADEIIELLLMTINGGVTPTGASPYVWTFTPGTSLDPATIEWDDGANEWEANGCYGGKLSIEGSVEEENKVTMDVFGMALVSTTMTGGLTEGVPSFIEGWETNFYIDAFGGTPGTTQIEGTLINWSIEIDNQLERKYFASNTQDAGAITLGEIMVSAKLTFEASASQSDTEFTNWDAATKRLVQLEFGQNELISGSDYKYVKFNLPGAWDLFDLGATDKNTRAYELSLQYVYDPTNAYGLQIVCQNDRAAADAWADRT